MKWLSEDFQNLRELYINQLRVLLSAEEQIVRALPNMINRANDMELQQAFHAHLNETEHQIKRLEQILAAEKAANPKITSVDPLKCRAISTLVDEAEDFILDAREALVRDAALIAQAQRIEHYEIASYGTMRQWAMLLGDVKSSELLDRTLKEEGHADHVLTSIAERVNPKAKAA